MRIINALIIVILLISGCTLKAVDTGSSSAPPSLEGIEGDLVQVGSECAQSIPALRAYQASFELPQEVNQQEAVDFPIENGIDVNQYFSYLDELDIEQGYALGYVYFSDQIGGTPVVYAHSDSQPAYSSYEEYTQAISGDASDEFSFSPSGNAFNYLAHIEIEDNAVGYFQYSALWLMGDQFYLYWHALYHDEVILCGQDDVDLIEASIDDFGLDVPEYVLQEAQELDLDPYVVMGDEAVVVRFVYFSKWGGLAEALVTIDRSFPYEIINIDGNPLVEYDCGIMF